MKRVFIIVFCFVCIQLHAQKSPVKIDTIRVGNTATFVCEWYKISLMDWVNREQEMIIVGPVKDTLYECSIKPISIDKNYKRYFKFRVVGIRRGKEFVSASYMIKNYKGLLDWGIYFDMLDEIGTIEITKTRKHGPAVDL